MKVTKKGPTRTPGGKRPRAAPRRPSTAAGSDPHPQVIALVENSISARGNGDLDAARKYAEDGLSLAQQLQDRCGEARSRFQIGASYGWAGEREKSFESFRESAAIEHDLGHHTEEAESWQALGEGLTTIGNHEGALDVLERMRAAAVRADNRHLEALALARIGDVQARQGRPKTAKATLRKAASIAKASGDVEVGTGALIVESRITAEEGNLDAAANLAMEAFEWAGEAGAYVQLGLAAAQVARVLLEAGEPELAYALLMDAIRKVAGKTGTLEVVDIVYHAAISLAETGHAADATVLLEKVFQMSEEAGEKQGMADAMFGLAKVAESEGNIERAVASYEAAAAFAIELGDQEVHDLATRAAGALRRSRR